VSSSLRPYRADDEEAAIALWQRTWQQAYPSIDFAERLAWWRERWRGELVPNTAIVVAEEAGTLVGFVTIDRCGYLEGAKRGAGPAESRRFSTSCPTGRAI
jgi:putative acetyltransferase